MAADCVLGVFASPDAAVEARRRLVVAGIPPADIQLSAHFSADAIAAEAPGQSYENQPGQRPEDSNDARRAELVRTGSCTVSVTPAGHGREEIARILRASGAHATLT